jgi:hypothetical protein
MAAGLQDLSSFLLKCHGSIVEFASDGVLATLLQSSPTSVPPPMLVRMPSSSNVAKPESSALDDTHAVEGEEPMDGEAAESIRGAKGGGKEISMQTVVPNEIAVGHEPEVEGNWATIMTSSLRDACQAAQVRTLSVNIFSLGIWCHFVRVVGA